MKITNQSKKVKSISVSASIPDILDRFNAGFDYVREHLVGRDSELKAVQLCMLCNGNLLLNGEPGLAKSRLARLAFKVIGSTDSEPVKVFSKQFMSTTLPEELFGPMSIKKLTEQSIFEFNTNGMLPDAHFFYADELFRGSAAVLPSLMSILNEGTFINNNKTLKCKLITTIATSNHVLNDPELEAFLDRFLIRHEVLPADSAVARRKILDVFLADENESLLEVADPITLSELRLLQDGVRKTVPGELVMGLYEDLVSAFKKETGGSVRVSDRRFCQAFRLVQAALFMANGGEPCSESTLDASCIEAAKFALVQDPAHSKPMESAMASIVGQFNRVSAEEPEIASFETQVNDTFRQYDPSLPEARKRKMFEKLTRVIEQLDGSTVAPEEQFTVPRNQERQKAATRKLHTLLDTLKKDLNV